MDAKSLPGRVGRVDANIGDDVARKKGAKSSPRLQGSDTDSPQPSPKAAPQRIGDLARRGVWFASSLSLRSSGSADPVELLKVKKLTSIEAWTAPVTEKIKKKGEQFLPASEAEYLVDSGRFQVCMSLMIAFNSVLVLVELCLEGKAASSLSIINLVFTLFYILELALVLGKGRHLGRKDAPYLLDVIFVMTALTERYSGAPLRLQGLPALRLFLNMFRMREMPWAVNYFTFVLEVVEKMWRVTLWALCLLVAVVWTFSIFAYIGIGQAAWFDDDLDPIQEGKLLTVKTNVGKDDVFHREYYFGTFWLTCFSFFQLATVSNWAAFARPVVQKQSILWLFFGLFAFGSATCLIHISVPTYVECLARAKTLKQQVQAEKVAEYRKSVARKALQVLQSIDKNSDGVIVPGEIDDALKTSFQLKGLLLELGIPEECINGHSIVTLLSPPNSSILEVTYEEFLDGLAGLEADLDHHDWTIMALRVESIARRMNLLSQRADELSVVLASVSKTIHRVREKTTSTLRDLSDGKDVTGARLYLNAKAYLRRPPEPPPISEKMRLILEKPPDTEPLLCAKEGAEFMNSLGRFLGSVSRGSNVAAAPTLRRAAKPKGDAPNLMSDRPPAALMPDLDAMSQVSAMESCDGTDPVLCKRNKNFRALRRQLDERVPDEAYAPSEKSGISGGQRFRF